MKSTWKIEVVVTSQGAARVGSLIRARACPSTEIFKASSCTRSPERLDNICSWPWRSTKKWCAVTPMATGVRGLCPGSRPTVVPAGEIGSTYIMCFASKITFSLLMRDWKR